MEYAVFNLFHKSTPDEIAEQLLVNAMQSKYPQADITNAKTQKRFAVVLPDGNDYPATEEQANFFWMYLRANELSVDNEK